MERFGIIKKAINEKIRTNGKRSITGEVLNNVLIGMVDATDVALDESLNGIVDYSQEIADLQKGKQDVIADLEQIRIGAGKGATSVQKVKTINGESIEGDGDIVIEVDMSALEDRIEANESATAAALTDLNNRITEVANSVIGALNTEV